MKNLPTRPSLRSSRNWPPIEIELRGSPRLAWCWAAWCGALAAALWWGCDLAWWWRLALLMIVAIALWRGVLEFLRNGGTTYVEADLPRRLGPLLWLKVPSSRRRRIVTLDTRGVEPNAWRAIKARMRFSRAAGRDKPA